MPRSGDAHIWLLWLTRLRWVAVAAQLITLGFAYPLLESLSLLIPLGAVIVVLLAANIRALAVLNSGVTVHPGTVVWQLGLDVAALTVFFMLGGGPSNPFTILYLVHVAMAAVMLRPLHAALLTVGVLGCYGALHLWSLPLQYENHSLDAGVLSTLGHLVAFGVTTISVSIFVVGLADTLRHRKAQLLEARDRTARTDRLRSVGTLAAGAAHELNTPLSTIGLRIRRIRRRYDDEDTVGDVEVLQSQLARCTRIVQQLLAGAGDPSAAGFECAPLVDLVKEATNMWTKGHTLTIEVQDLSGGAPVELPRVAFAQALTNLLENAREAQESVGDFSPLELSVLTDQNDVVIELRDHGCGLPKEPDQVGTPFFTTKVAGTGLGVFVARQVADGAGGGLSYNTHPEGGTTARWWFPRATRRANEPKGFQAQAAGGG